MKTFPALAVLGIALALVFLDHGMVEYTLYALTAVLGLGVAGLVAISIDALRINARTC